jgi:hypothetical protein
MNEAQMELLTVGTEPEALLRELVQGAGIEPHPVDVSQI